MGSWGWWMRCGLVALVLLVAAAAGGDEWIADLPAGEQVAVWQAAALSGGPCELSGELLSATLTLWQLFRVRIPAGQTASGERRLGDLAGGRYLVSVQGDCAYELRFEARPADRAESM